MPELRSGVRRRGRAPAQPPALSLERPTRKPRGRAARGSEPSKVPEIARGRGRSVAAKGPAVPPAPKTRGGPTPGADTGAEGKPRTRLAAARLVLVEEENVSEQLKYVVLEGENIKGIGGVVGRRPGDGQEEVSAREESPRKKGVMGDDSGGLSANKAAGQEEEGSTAPFPERVISPFEI